MQLIHSLAEVNHHDGTPTNFVIDCPSWASFDSLQRELQKYPPKKNADKYTSILSMYMTNEEMLEVGLSNVLHKVVEICLATDIQQINERNARLADGSEGFEASETCGYQGLRLLAQRKPSLPKLDQYKEGDNTSAMSLKDSLSLTSDESLKRSHTHDQSTKKLMRSSELVDSRASLSTSGTSGSSSSNESATIDSTTIFSVTSSTMLNLTEVFGDGEIVEVAVAAAENIEVKLVEKLNDFEWVFRANTYEAAEKLLKLGQFRVLGYNLIANAVLPSI